MNFSAVYLPNSISFLPFLSLQQPQGNQNYGNTTNTINFCPTELEKLFILWICILGCQQMLLKALCHCPLTDHRSPSVSAVFPCIAYTEGMTALLPPIASFHSVWSCLWEHHVSVLFASWRLFIGFPGYCRYCRGSRHTCTDGIIVRDLLISLEKHAKQ